MSEGDASNLNAFMFKELAGKTLITTDLGEPRFYENGVVERLFNGTLTSEEKSRLSAQSVLINSDERWKWLSITNRHRKKFRSKVGKLSYLIVVPTLRCNLSCSYCQVSRAPVKAKGYDLSPENVEQLESFIAENGQDGMKIEFQGGECTLRLDLVERIIAFTERCFAGVEFVLCSNLLEVGEKELQLFSRENVYVSTSLDGDFEAMVSNRTDSDKGAQQTINNIERMLDLFGPEKISALPTITDQQVEDPMSVISPYLEFGFGGVFLRPVNYQGFARKSFAELSKATDRWLSFYSSALELIGDLNKEVHFEEFYLAMLLRTVFTPGEQGYVDFKSPARYGTHYMVVDFDGTLYPTDEARMLSRTRHIDLSVGSLQAEFNSEKVEQLNREAIHQVHHDCIHCVYKPFCGIDIVDDFSRYDRLDFRKNETWFCQRQTFVFDFIFEKLASQDRHWQKVFGTWITKNRPAVLSPEFFQ